MMDDQGVSLGPPEAQAETLKGDGRTVIDVARAGGLIGLIAIAIADAPRPAAIRKLPEQGVKVAMLTGDNSDTAIKIAAVLGIDIVLADVLPGQKSLKIRELQAGGEKVGRVAR